MSSHADTIRHYLVQYLPDGFRDEDGNWHEGPHRVQALAALNALLAENQRLREALERIVAIETPQPPVTFQRIAREALAGDAK